MSPVLALENVSVMRGDRLVLRDVTVRVAGGSALLVRGHNGSGKTTLIRSIAGLLSPLSGRIEFDGATDEVSTGEQSHLVGHANGIKPALTVRENLAFWNRYLGGAREALDRAIRHFQLDEIADVPSGMLSAGQKRRTGLARLLVAHRPLWLLDEPTTSLDSGSARLLVGAVSEHLRDGGLAVIATHLDLPLDGADVLLLERGAVISGQVTGAAE